jgi:two-component system, sensor histidine kinase ChiS
LELQYRLRKIMSLMIIFVAITSIYILMYTTFNPIGKRYEAKHGEIDLSNWYGDSIVMLNGEWDFYPGELILPENIPDYKLERIEVPGDWSRKQPFTQSGRGCGTYHLKIKLPDKDMSYAIKIQNIWMAHKIYINSAVVGEEGKVAKDRVGFLARNNPYVINVGKAKELDIVVQVANYIYYDGGIIQPILFGEMSDINSNDRLNYSLDMAALFTILLFAVIHIFIYILSHKDLTYLYSGLYLLAITFGSITTSEKLLMRFLFDLPFSIPYKIQDFTVAAGFVFLSGFIYTIEPQLFSKRKRFLLKAPIYIYCLAIIILPYEVYINYKIAFASYLTFFIVVLNVRFFGLMFRKNIRELPFNEYLCIAGSMSFITLTFFNSILFYNGMSNGNIIGKLAAWAYLISLNAFLACRFMNNVNAIKKLSEDLILAGKMKDEFLGRTSQELKEPLNNIRDTVSYLLNSGKKDLSTEQKYNLEIVKSIASRSYLRINDLNDIVRLKNNDLKLDIQTVDIYPIINLAIHLLSYDIENKNLRLKNLVKPFTYALGDELRIKQIILAILSNAVNYTYVGTITIEADSDEDKVVINISDTGIGISRKDWDNVFQGTDEEGSELPNSSRDIKYGLYISRQLAAKMNGTLSILSSDIGQGSTFSLKLPSAKIATTEIETVPTDCVLEQQQAQEYMEDNLQTILLVDDSYLNIHAMTIILGERYRVLKASNGFEALQHLSQRKTDLVITDMVMPGMSGIELIKHIRERYSLLELPIIAITTNDTIDNEVLYQQGVNDSIIKPVTKEILLIRVQTCLQLKSATLEALNNQRAFLQAQIKPHFIYNALTNIIALCYEDGEKAANMLSLLSKYLRYVFQMEQNENNITLKEEMDIIEKYVLIEKLRYGERLVYRVRIDEDIHTEDYLIPALILQPLVENAIRHGIFDKKEVGHIELNVKQEGDKLSIRVTDDGVGMEPDVVEAIINKENIHGVALKNIVRRIELNSEASFRLTSKTGVGTEIILMIPKQKVEATRTKKHV